MKHIKILSVIALISLVAACSSTPDRNNALEQARNNYAAAQNNPQITSLAADELRQAGEALRRAEQAWDKRNKDADVDHLAYLADQRIAIARETASTRASQAIVESASERRNEIRLEQRTNEAEQAKQRLTEAEAAAQRERERAAELEQELDAKRTERGMVVTLGDVLFETGKSQLLPAATRNISRLADFLKNHPETRVTIEGHTDSTGSTSFNYQLGQQRADSVRNALVSMGIASDRLSTRSHGPDMPTADNNTAAGRQMNRRVEIIFPNSNSSESGADRHSR